MATSSEPFVRSVVERLALEHDERALVALAVERHACGAGFRERLRRAASIERARARAPLAIDAPDLVTVYVEVIACPLTATRVTVASFVSAASCDGGVVVHTIDAQSIDVRIDDEDAFQRAIGDALRTCVRRLLASFVSEPRVHFVIDSGSAAGLLACDVVRREFLGTAVFCLHGVAVSYDMDQEWLRELVRCLACDALWFSPRVGNFDRRVALGECAHVLSEWDSAFWSTAHMVAMGVHWHRRLAAAAAPTK